MRFIAVIADQHRRELAGAGIGDIIQQQEAQAQRRARQCHHAGQLPATQNADCGHGRRGSALASMVSVCCLRNAAKRCCDVRELMRQHGRREQAGIGRAGHADGEGGDRNAGRHLGDG